MGPVTRLQRAMRQRGGVPYQTQGKTQTGLAPLRDEVFILLDGDGVGCSAVRIQEEENRSDEPGEAAAAVVRARNNGGLSALEVEINDKPPHARRPERGATRVPQPWFASSPCPALPGSTPMSPVIPPKLPFSSL